MPRALRIALWSLGTLAVVTGGLLLWVDSQLRAEPLGLRVKALLAEAKIQGGIAKIEAELDGRFTAEGVDLTLPDGLQFKAASVTGDLGVLASVFGTLREAKINVQEMENVVFPGGAAIARSARCANSIGVSPGSSLPLGRLQSS